MKTVFAADMVCHIWANRSQDTARTASNNLYFTGPTLYSYGSHFVIGHFLNTGAVLMSEASYSNTTAKHMSYARRALSRSTRVLHVPSMNDNLVRDLSNCKTGHRKGQLPELAQQCVAHAIELISSIAGMRSIDKMNATLAHARSMEKSARALAEYVQVGRRKLNIGLPVLPDSVPADKEARAAWIRSVAKAKLLGILAQRVEAFEQGESRLIGTLDSAPNHACRDIEVTFGHLSQYMGYVINGYADAHGRKMPATQIAKLRARVDALAPRVKKAQRDYWYGASEHEILGAFKHISRRQKLAPENSYSINRYEQTCDALRTAAARLHGFTDGKHWLIPIAARLERVLGHRMAVLRLDRAGDQITSAESYGVNHPGDAERHYSNALRLLDLARMPHNGHPAILKSHGARHAALREIAQAGFDQMRAVKLAKEKTRIDDWLNGTSNVRPAGFTLARIKGDAVETTLGAHVPIAHACRLARIARRVIAQGGREWGDNDGPQVGHFRVRSIGADGRTVIGCHEFEASEALRMLALLETCAACQHETAEV